MINVVWTINLVNPLTFKVPKIDVSLFNVAKPDILIDDNNIVLLFNVLNPETFKEEYTETLLFNVVEPVDETLEFHLGLPKNLAIY